MERHVWAVMQKASAGGDQQMVLAASDRQLKIAERRAGLAAPGEPPGELRQRRLGRRKETL